MAQGALRNTAVVDPGVVPPRQNSCRVDRTRRRSEDEARYGKMNTRTRWWQLPPPESSPLEWVFAEVSASASTLAEPIKVVAAESCCESAYFDFRVVDHYDQSEYQSINFLIPDTKSTLGSWPVQDVSELTSA